MMAWRGVRVGLVLAVGAGLAVGASGVWAQDTVVGQASVAVPGGEIASKGVSARAARLTLLSEGVVLVGRNGGGDTAPAQQNMALAQGSLVSAMDNGQVEIEFEDGSVARLTPNSSLSLDYLAANNDGTGYVTIVRVVHGLAYLELRSSGISRYRVMAGGDTFWPVDNSTVRVNLDDPPAVISVLDGRVRVEHVSTPAGLTADAPQAIEGYRTDVRAGESLRSDAGDASRYFLTESVPPGTWDQWNEERDQAAANEVAGATPVREGFAGSQGYGWGDLDASGNWYGAPGQTPVWQPDEALEAGFDPYGYGSWTNFSGAGYVWASGYSWGWTPYRCGNWQFWDGFGWGWQPNSFCGTGFRYGGYGVNVGRGPRGYPPIQVPIRRGGVHPIVPGPHPGVRLALTRGPRQTTEVGDRIVAGVVMQPIRSARFGYTARGGSAVGSSLRRDFPVDGRTHQALMGTVGASGPALASPVSGGTAWRAVATRPEAPARESGGLHWFGHGSRQVGDAPVRVDAKGNPFSEPVRRGNDAGQGRTVQQQTFGSGGQQRSQAVGGAPAYRGAGNVLSAPHYNPPPAPVMHSAPTMAPAPVMHSAPAAPAGAARK